MLGSGVEGWIGERAQNIRQRNLEFLLWTFKTHHRFFSKKVVGGSYNRCHKEGWSEEKGILGKQNGPGKSAGELWPSSIREISKGMFTERQGEKNVACRMVSQF